MRLRVYYDNGVVIDNGRFKVLVDPVGKPKDDVDVILVTHAHRDHVNSSAIYGLRIPVVMSALSSAVIRSRDNVSLRFTSIMPNSTVDLDDARIEAFNAGHVMGSLMYIIEFSNYRVGITGDFNVEDSVILEGARALENVDVLIMEATYGTPDYVFPSRDSIYNDIMDFVEKSTRDGVAVLMGQALGRGQELTALFKRHPIYLEYGIKALNNALGIRDGKVLSGTVEDGSVVIMGIQGSIEGIRRRLGKLRARFMVLSGVYAKEARRRALMGIGIESAPLSSHSDFLGLVDFALSSNAKFIYTVYGHAKELAKYLRKLNLQAREIPRVGQTFMDDYL